MIYKHFTEINLRSIYEHIIIINFEINLQKLIIFQSRRNIENKYCDRSLLYYGIGNFNERYYFQSSYNILIGF